MLNNLTAAFLAEMDKEATTPIQLMVFHFDQPTGDIFVSDRDIMYNGQLYDGLIESWGELATVNAENAVSSTMTMETTLWNGGSNPFSNYFLIESPINVFVDVYQTYDGLSDLDKAHIGEFVIQDPVEHSEASRLLSLELVTTNMRYFAQVGELLTKEKFPNALESDINKSIDLIVGESGRIKCICSNSPLNVSLDRSIVRTTINIETKESLEDFPLFGTLQINGEFLTYSSRSEFSFVASARGVNETKASDHSAGSAVIQSGVDVDYIVGQYPLASVNEIFVGGKITTLNPQIIENENNNGVVLLRFEEQPIFADLGSTKSDTVFFDNTNSENTALFPFRAYSADYKTQAAVINNVNKLLDISSLVDEISSNASGEIVNAFIKITTWAERNYLSDYIRLWCFDWFPNALSRPDEQASLTLTADVDIDHPHLHDTGGTHEHSSSDAGYSSDSSPHKHDLDGSEDSVTGSITSQTLRATEYNSRYEPYSPFKSTHTRTFFKFKMTGGNINSYLVIGSTTIRYDSGTHGVTFTGSTTRADSIKYYSTTSNGSVYFEVWDIVVYFGASVTDNTEADISTIKTNDGSVGNNTAAVKSSSDVQSLVTSNRGVTFHDQESFTSVFTEKFDLFDIKPDLQWNDLQGIRAILEYVGNVDDIDFYIQNIEIEVEFRPDILKVTNDITCIPVGSIENRPDAVIQYLLTEKAGVPIEKLGSVYRNIPKWDDLEIWDDSETWQDEGQVAGVPDGAAFEEAGAWFDLRNYRIDGVLSGNLTVKDAITKTAFQSRSKLLWQYGEAKLIVFRKSQDWLSAKSIVPNDTQIKSYSSKKSLVSDIINKIDLFHTINRLSDAAGSGQYDLTAYKKDDKSILKHGEHTNDEKWLFDLIRQQEIADDLADYYLWELGETTTYYSFRTYLKHYDIEKEDYINITSVNFENLNKVSVVIKELIREFGSGKLSKINTLNIIAQSIRRIVYLEFPESPLFMGDTLNIDFKDTVTLSEQLVIFEKIISVQNTSKEEEILIADIFSVLAAFNKSLFDILPVTDEINSKMYVNLEDSFQIDEVLGISDILGFGSCGFGAPNCEIPFGSPLPINEIAVDYANTIDSLEILLNKSIEDNISIDDSLLITGM